MATTIDIELGPLKITIEKENKLLTELPIPVIIHCPKCSTQHIDRGEWYTKPHKRHRCEHCEFVWKVANVHTVGVAGLV